MTSILFTTQHLPTFVTFAFQTLLIHMASQASQVHSDAYDDDSDKYKSDPCYLTKHFSCSVTQI